MTILAILDRWLTDMQRAAGQTPVLVPPQVVQDQIARLRKRAARRKRLHTATIAITAMFVVLSGCVINTPKPAPVGAATVSVKLLDNDTGELLPPPGDVAISYGLQAQGNQDVNGRVSFGAIPCNLPVTAVVKVAGYLPDRVEEVASAALRNCPWNPDYEITIRLTKKPAPPAPPKPVWPPKPRAPLPPHNPSTFESPDDSTPKSWHPVFTTAPVLPPPDASCRVHRGDAWGVTVPGLPDVPGGARPGTPAASRVLTYFLGRYERAKPGMEQTILEAHAAAGYTHFSLSPQDEFAEGMSEAEYVAMSVRVKRAVGCVHHLFLSKYYTDAANPDLTQSFRLMDALAEAGALDVITPAWEMNFMQPDVVRRVINAFAAKRDALAVKYTARARLALHFFPHYISWQANDETPGHWWNENIRVGVDAVYYQGNPEWTMGMLSARIQDCLQRLVAGGTWGLTKSIDFILWEDIATQQYNNLRTGNGRLADEAEGNLRGLEGVSVPGPMPVIGYGGGARKMDGSAL